MIPAILVIFGFIVLVIVIFIWSNSGSITPSTPTATHNAAYYETEEVNTAELPDLSIENISQSVTPKTPDILDAWRKSKEEGILGRDAEFYVNAWKALKEDDPGHITRPELPENWTEE